jgi:hypothetical protein
MIPEWRNAMAIGVAKAAIAGRIAMNVDAAMRVATGGCASRLRRTRRCQSGETEQQNYAEIICDRPCHCDIPGPLQPSFRTKETLQAKDSG